MKHLTITGNKLALLLMFVAASVCFSCGDSNDEPSVTPASVQLTVKLATEYNKVSLGKVKITLRNTATGKETKVITDAGGSALVSNLPIDMYDVTATYSMSAADFKTATGLDAEKDSVLFSASATGVQLVPGKATALNLELNTATTDNFVLKTIYYAGSDRVKAASDYDQFIEIYNNSSKTLYADSLCIAITTMNRYGNGHPYQSQRYVYLEDGRYDWSKAQGMPENIDANNAYYYANMVFMIPGKGKTYPVKPGESIVIASFAQNFKASFTNLRGDVIKPQAPELTVDLSHADFEGAYERTKEMTNPAVPDLIIVHPGNNTYMRLSNNGKEGYVLFRSSDPSKYPLYLYPTKPNTQGSNSQFMQIPVSTVIDAVEVISPTNDGYVAPKAIQKKDDAGYTWAKSGTYSSMAITRKVSRLDGTRRVLQDINNSTLDFVEMKAEPKAFAPQN